MCYIIKLLQYFIMQIVVDSLILIPHKAVDNGTVEILNSSKDIQELLNNLIH